MNSPEKQSPASSPLLDLLEDPIVITHSLHILPGQALYEADHPALHYFYVKEGQVRVFQVTGTPQWRLLAIIGPGDWCGSAALAGLPQYGSRAEAVEHVLVKRIDVQTLLPRLCSQAGAAQEMIQLLARKATSAWEEQGRLAHDDVERRVIQALLRFARSAAAGVQDGQIVVRLTHEHLAQAVGAARETVSLLLSDLRRRSLITTGRNRIQFDLDTLQQCAAAPRSMRQAIAP